MTRIPPFNVEAERSVLGALLLANECIESIAKLLTSKDFYTRPHRIVFAAILKLHADGIPADEVTLNSFLAAERVLQICGGASYLATLTDGVPTTANVHHYAAIVKECSRARQIIETASAASEDAFANRIEESIAKLATLVAIDAADDDEILEEAISSTSDGWPQLNEMALYGLAGQYVRALEPHTESDRAAILVQLLVTFGNIIGRGPHFLAEADRHYTNEFVVLVGNTAKGRKGSSWGHIRRLCEAIDPEWVKENIRSGLASGEGLVHAVRDEVGSRSSETIALEKRLLILEGEFASTLAVARREGNTLSSTIRNAWDGVILGNLTKNNPDYASDTHISIIGHITQDELRKRLDLVDVANGFANRFVWICVRRSKLLPDGGTFDAIEAAWFAGRIKQAIEFARNVKEMRRDEGGRMLWHRAYSQLARSKSGVIDALTCRGEAHVMRLACLYALLDRSNEIRIEHLNASLALWQYAEASCRYIFGESLGNPVADTIHKALRSRPAGMTRTEISALFGRNKSKDIIDAALALLATNGLAISTSEKTAGAIRSRWRASSDDEVSEPYSDANERENRDTCRNVEEPTLAMQQREVGGI